MDDFKVFMADRSIQLMDNCESGKSAWNFSVINSSLLLEQLAFCKESCLAEFLLGEGMDSIDDLEEEAMGLVSDRQTMNGIEEKFKKKEEKTSDKEEGENKEETKPENNDSKITSYSETSISFKDATGNMHSYIIDDEVETIFEEVLKLCQKNNITCIDPVHILAGMFLTDDDDLRSMMDSLDISYSKAKEFFTSGKAFINGIIPYSLSGFLYCWNSKIDIEKPCEILMRDKEVEQIWNISMKKNKRNTIIVGEAGVGKSALIEKITYDIVSGKCPERFLNFYVVGLDVNSLIAGTTFRGQAEERIKDLIEFLERRNDVILFIDEIHTILGAGACVEGEMDLANALKPILARGDTIVIGATTDIEYVRYFVRDAALSRRFERVTVDEPVAKEVYPMIKNKIKVLSEFHGVKISKQMVEYAILISNCFAFEKKNPDKTLDLIDRSMVVAARKGKKSVDKDCIIKNFDIYFDLYENMGEDARKEVAYHEAGHYIVGKASGRLIEYNWLAVSIMPSETYLGVTCFEYRKDRVAFRNRDYYIDSVAFDLGGRVAEKIFRNDETAGAGQDLDSATQMAFDIVTKFGMGSKKEERNNILLNTPEYPMLTEKATNKVIEEVKNIVSLGTKRAEEIINSHIDLLEAIVKELLKKRIVSETELDVIWKQYVK